MNKYKRIALHTSVFMGLLVFLWLLLALAAAIPNTALQTNMEQSALSYKEKATYSYENGDKWNGIGDNYADAVLLNVSWNMGRGNPFLSSLDTWYYNGEALGENVGLYLTVIDETIPLNTDYTRYWHGSAMFVRLLHLITDVDGIKWIGFLAVLLCALITIGILIRHGHICLAAALALSMLSVQIWNIRLSLEYQPTFLLCFLFSCLYLWSERNHETYLTYLSIAGGVLTAFFDFLTTETLVLLLPLILVVAVRAAENRLGSFRENIRLIASCGLCWLLAYGGAFIMKWTAASLAAGENKFLIALSSVEERIGGGLLGRGPENPLLRIPAAILANLTVLFGGDKRLDLVRVVLGLLFTVLICGSLLYLFHRGNCDKTALKLLALLGSVVFLRYMVLNNHSYLHEFFTYRALFAPIMALLSGMILSMELPVRKKKGIKKQ
ncbi:MAG: hypothetical protein K2N01_02605 [Lachnospiraceae bacterium]|nr:hypothetical protein [Lachnospiraceae bacterium]